MKFTTTAVALTLFAGASAASDLIPSDVSSACSSFLNGLDTDATFSSCVKPLYTLTASFNPVTGLGSDNITTSTITSTLTSLCATSAKCSDTSLSGYLGQFASACSADLSNSTTIKEMYDYLYLVQPFRTAVCTKDSTTQKFCAIQIATTAAAASSSSSVTNSTNAVKLNAVTSSASSFFAPVLEAASNLVIYTPLSDLTRRFLPSINSRAAAETQSTLMTPNATVYRTTSLPYLFLTSDMTSTVLCTTCTKAVMAAYIAWEAQVPYASGLSSSPILGAQQTLWSGIESTCGTNFTDAISVQAGVVASNGSTTTTSAGERMNVGKGAVSGLVFAIAGTVIASLI